MSAGIRVHEAPGAQGWGVRAMTCRELGFFQVPRHLKFSEFLLVFSFTETNMKISTSQVCSDQIRSQEVSCDLIFPSSILKRKEAKAFRGDTFKQQPRRKWTCRDLIDVQNTRLSLKVVVTCELVPKHSKPNKMDLFLCDRLMPKNYLGVGVKKPIGSQFLFLFHDRNEWWDGGELVSMHWRGKGNPIAFKTEKWGHFI